MNAWTIETWRVNNDESETAFERFIVDRKVSIAHVYKPNAEANAALIVRAVNAHAAMLAALKEARGTLIRAITANVELEGFDPTEHVMIQKIDAAIRLAEGGT